MTVCAAVLVLRQAQHEDNTTLLTPRTPHLILSLSKDEQRRSSAR
jgi:hypothetical protein